MKNLQGQSKYEEPVWQAISNEPISIEIKVSKKQYKDRGNEYRFLKGSFESETVNKNKQNEGIIILYGLVIYYHKDNGEIARGQNNKDIIHPYTRSNGNHVRLLDIEELDVVAMLQEIYMQKAKISVTPEFIRERHKNDLERIVKLFKPFKPSKN